MFFYFLLEIIRFVIGFASASVLQNFTIAMVNSKSGCCRIIIRYLQVFIKTSNG